MKVKLIVLFIFAFLIRLIALNQSLWLDEATVAKVALHIPFLKIIPSFSIHDFHPPLYYLMIKLWTGLFGYTEIALRMPSVIASLLTGYVVYLISKKLKNEIVALWSAALFLLNPLIVYYSQEARMYMVATLFLAVALYYFLNVLSDKKINRSHDILFVLFTILAFYTFYGSIFFIVPMYIYLFVKKRNKCFYCLTSAFILSFLFISPLLLKQWMNAKDALRLVANWKQVLGQTNLKNLFLIPLKFTSGRISFSPKLFYYEIGGMWGLWTIWEVIKGGLRDKRLVFFLAAPLLLGIIFSFFSPLLQYFRFLYLIPVMSLLLVLGARGNGERAILLAGFITFSCIYLLIPGFHREDWKSLSLQAPDHSAVYMIPSSSDALAYYRPDVTIKDLRRINPQSLPKEFIVLPYTSDIYGLSYTKELIRENFYLQKSQVFTGNLIWEHWSKR